MNIWCVPPADISHHLFFAKCRLDKLQIEALNKLIGWLFGMVNLSSFLRKFLRFYRTWILKSYIASIKYPSSLRAQSLSAATNAYEVFFSLNKSTSSFLPRTKLTLLREDEINPLISSSVKALWSPPYTVGMWRTSSFFLAIYTFTCFRFPFYISPEGDIKCLVNSINNITLWSKQPMSLKI